jgi:hypothetical protein
LCIKLTIQVLLFTYKCWPRKGPCECAHTTLCAREFCMLKSHLTHKKSVIGNVLMIAECPYSPIRMEYICLHTHLKWNRIISHIYSTNLEILVLWHELFYVVQQYIHVHWLEKSTLLFYRDKHALNMILLEDGWVISIYRLPSTWTIPWVVTQ